MATRMQQRRGTASQWSSANPILNVAEIGFETDTNKFKIGDGTNHWEDLTYFVDAGQLADIIDGAPALLDTLNELAAAIGDDPSFMTTVATNLSNHASDTTSVHGIADTAELATKTYANDAVSTHSSDTTSVHGIADTSLLATTTYVDDAVGAIDLSDYVTLTGTQTLSNKTLESPTVTVSAGVSIPMIAGYIGEDGYYSTGGTAYAVYDDSPYYSQALAYYESLGGTPFGSYVTGSVTVQGVTSGGYISGTHSVRVGDFGMSIVFVWDSIPYQSGATFSSPTIGWGGSTATISATEISYLDGVTSNIQTQLDAKLESSDIADFATESYVTTAIGNLVDSAPSALDTLNELAAALGDDANYAATITTALGEKAPLEDPTFTGTVDLSGATVVGLPEAGPTAVEIVMGVY